MFIEAKPESRKLFQLKVSDHKINEIKEEKSEEDV